MLTHRVHSNSFIKIKNIIESSSKLKKYCTIDGYGLSWLVLSSLKSSPGDWSIFIQKNYRESDIYFIWFYINSMDISFENFLMNEKVPNIIKQKIVFNLDLFYRV